MARPLARCANAPAMGLWIRNRAFSVAFKEALHPARGGLRLNFTAHPEGAFHRRAYLAQQNIDLVATLRAPELMERIGSPTPTIGAIFARAMLLGDPNFADREEVVDFQKTGVFHVFVVAVCT